MKDGIIQQVAAPTVLYEYPCNLFVAQFIGSPQMNTFEATVVDEDGSTYLSFGKSRIKLPAAKGRNPEVLAYAGKEVIVGIRPEALHDEEAILAQFPDATVDADVDVIEQLGFITYLYLIIEGNNITASVNPRSTVKAGDKIKIAFDSNRIHLFDKDTEKVIAG
jgi:multiple sugar transport system ATP-binding protein